MDTKNLLRSKIKISLLAAELNLMIFQRAGKSSEEYKETFDTILNDLYITIAQMEPKVEGEVL